MKKFEITIVITFIACAIVALLFSCGKTEDKQEEEIATARVSTKNCFTVCNVDKNPDLKLITNAYQNQPQKDGTIDSTTYFWTKYHVRTYPVRLVQNFLTTSSNAIRYGWDSGVLINRIQLQCLLENVRPFDSTCVNDWVFNESQGYQLPGQNYFFDGLFQFDTYEKGNGNNWKFLYSDYKKEFFPSVVPTREYVYNINFCYYDRGIPAQTGDFYYNYFRLPNHDGIYKIIVRFNPQIKGCRAVKETDYTNNEEALILEIIEGTIKIIQ